MKTATRKKKPQSAAPDGNDRAKFIGGSDAAAILGVSPWRSAYRLWAEKQGDEDDIVPDLSLKPWIEWGNILEPVVAEQFAKKTGMKVEVEPRFLTHAKHPFIGGHIDRRISGKRSLLECKTANAFDYRMWGDPEQGYAGVPLHYLAQVDHYMMTGDFLDSYVAVLIGGSDFRIYYVARNAIREKRLLAAELQFWDMVKNDIMPPIMSEADAKHRWRTALEGTSIPVDDIVKGKVIALARVAERKKIAEKEEKALRNEIFPIFRDAQALSDSTGERIAYLTCYDRDHFDKEKFAKKNAKLLKKFTIQVATKKLKLTV